MLERRFSRRTFWATVDRHRATSVNAVPAIIALLAEQPTTTSDPARVRFVRSASAPLPVPVLERFEQVHGIPVLESYGMTEAASQITVNPLDDQRPGSVGRPVDGELRVLGDGGRALPAGESGRVQVRGPGVITGTYRHRRGPVRRRRLALHRRPRPAGRRRLPVGWSAGPAS